jgi:CheY-like chemotaxis protein
MRRPEVLVVDDDVGIAGALGALFEGEGYAVRVAHNGLAALAAAKERPPDVVVADVMMPGMDGLALATRLRARGIPTVLMSAVRPNGGTEDVRFVPKPFDLDDLLVVVEDALSARG